MTDVVLSCTPDGGEVSVTNGQAAMDDGLRTAVYLSLFGGNEQDSGLQAVDKNRYWADLCEPDSSLFIRSQTQYLLRSIPAIPANLARIRDAALADLNWMTTELKAVIDVNCTMQAVNRISITGSITINLKKVPFEFDQPWAQAAPTQAVQ